MSTLKNRLNSAQTETSNDTATMSVKELYTAISNANKISGDDATDKIKAQQALADCMLSFIISMESTRVYKDKNNIVHNKPIEHFYFCTKGGLTIGYGNKIECKTSGKLEKEGRAILEKAKIMRNGRELSMREKEAVVKNCYDRRTYCATTKNKKQQVDLTTLSAENQKGYLFNKTDYCTIDSQSAFEISRLEYEDKNQKLVTATKSFIKDSYFLEALGTDFHYQFGDTGIKEKIVYKRAIKKLIPKKLYTGDQKAETDREKLRELICELAYETNQDKKKRKDQPASPESQSAFCINALQKFCTTFEDGIRKRQAHKTLLMEQYMTLVFAQSIKNVQNRDLTLAEVQRAKQMAHSLVYDELFHSPILQQVSNQYKPATLVGTIKNLNKNLNLPENLNSTDKNPFQLIRDSLNQEAKIRIDKNKNKNKDKDKDNENQTLNPTNKTANNIALMSNYNGRW